VESFAADVSHEIKNPLASLRSAVESFPRVEDPELRAQLAQIASHDVRRIDRLVSEISDASRIDAELSRAVFTLVDLCELVENIAATREDRAENNGINIDIKRPSQGLTVNAVPIRLERVIENLLDNAVSFSPVDGSVTVQIGLRDEWVRLSVCDNGPGIPADAREKVFSRFHSDRPNDEDFGNHSGLGLAIARTITQAHDGTLTAQPRADGRAGACLVLELPDPYYRPGEHD